MIERRAARVILIADDAVLLVKGCDPARPEAGEWWITPGGGLNDGETLEAGAVREVFEETGLTLDLNALGPVVWTRLIDFNFEGQDYRQHESFFVVRVEPFTPHNAGWEEVEHRALIEYRWWPVAELRTTAETVYPEELSELLSET